MLWQIAWKNLLRQRRRSLLTGLTMLVGYFIVSLAIGMQFGSWGQVIEAYTGAFSGHIQIHAENYRDRPSLYKTLAQNDLEQLNQLPYIESWTPRLYSVVLTYANERALATSLVGLDPERETRTTSSQARLWKGEFLSNAEPQKALVSYQLSKRLKLELGDELVLISQAADGSIANDIFFVGGILGLPEDESPELVCYLGLESAQNFLVMPGRVHEAVLKVDSYHNARHYADLARTDLSKANWDIQPWQVIEKVFYEAMLADNKGSYIAIAIVAVMVGLGVLNTVLMNLLERTRELGIMLAIGTRPRQLLLLIMMELSMLASLSCLIGAIFSSAANAYLTWYGIALGEPIRFGGMTFATYHSTLDPETYWLPILVVMATTFVVGFIPAYRVTRIRVVEALWRS